MTKLKLVFNLGFIKEMISSFIPGVLAYLDFLDKRVAQNMAIGASVLVFLGLFIILLFVKIREYQRSVSRALANGYFRNFVEKLVALFNSKGKNKIKFFFEDGEKEFTMEQISVTIFLKNSYSELKTKNTEISKQASITYVDKDAFNYPFFVWAKAQDGKLFIYDLPRTLFSLKDYINADTENGDELDKETKKFYKRFNSEFRKLWTKLDKGELDINVE